MLPSSDVFLSDGSSKVPVKGLGKNYRHFLIEKIFFEGQNFPRQPRALQRQLEIAIKMWNARTNPGKRNA